MRSDACASEIAAAVMPLRLEFASCGVCVLEKACCCLLADAFAGYENRGGFCMIAEPASNLYVWWTLSVDYLAVFVHVFLQAFLVC